MSTQVSGTYEGEGPNVSGPLAAANVPDVQSASTSATTTGQGRSSSVAITRRRQMRVSSESARSETPINVGSGDQKLTVAARGVYVSGAGNLVCRLVDATADSTFTGLTAGSWYPFAVAVVRQTGTTITGNLLF